MDWVVRARIKGLPNKQVDNLLDAMILVVEKYDGSVGGGVQMVSSTEFVLTEFVSGLDGIQIVEVMDTITQHAGTALVTSSYTDVPEDDDG